ncbi:hypothetical protein BC834DRAFT_49050 [Gloeopeniophorella convolvens]|nr:hypothetical protein BC834DRAFT_49050 [Gloeopeniophorella convolvens]
MEDPDRISARQSAAAEKHQVEFVEGLGPPPLEPPLQPDGTFAPKDILGCLRPASIEKMNRELAHSKDKTDAQLSTSLSYLHAAVVSVIGTIPKLITNVIEEKDFQDRLSEPSQQRDVFQLFREMAQQGDFRELVVNDLFFKIPLDAFKPYPKPPRAPSHYDYWDVQNQLIATERSWTIPFADADDLMSALGEHVTECTKHKADSYRPYCPIVQSSGTGKSRLVDEFTKTHFSIPITLRKPDSMGFPPGDVNAYEYLTHTEERRPPEASYARMYAFLGALLWKATGVVESLGGADREARIQNFREYMTEGQNMERVGEKRRLFYDAVLEKANELLRRRTIYRYMSTDPGGTNMVSAQASALRTVLYSPAGVPDHSDFPDVFIAVDEAHLLIDQFGYEPESNLSALRQALRMLDDGSSFAFFISTSAKICETWPHPPPFSSSSRIIPSKVVKPSIVDMPYSVIGYDQLMIERKIGIRFCTIKEVASMECIVHLGRPLWGSRYDNGDREVRDTLLRFAQVKLLCGSVGRDSDLDYAQRFAILSRRLPLDINTMRHAYPPLPNLHDALKQVSTHMRICMDLSRGYDYLVTEAPSEPILSEAASLLMRPGPPSFSLPRTLKEAFDHWRVPHEDHGALVVAAFFTWARDKVAAMKYPGGPPSEACSPTFSVQDLFSELFVSDVQDHRPSVWRQGYERKKFGDTFTETHMHFNHFLRALEKEVLRGKFLLGYLGRGAAAFATNCHKAGVDMVFPFLYQGDALKVTNIGYILVLVKLYGQPVEPKAELFKYIDPFLIGVLDESDPNAGDVPIIRIVFSLSNSQPGLKRMSYSNASEAAYVLKDGKPRFTSYDYWCSGMSQETLRPVGDNPRAWEEVASGLEPLHWDFSGPPGSALDILQRSMFPLASTNAGHWGWTDPPPQK